MCTADPDVVVENRPSRGLSLLEGVEEMAKSVIPRTLHLGDSRDSLIMAGGSQSDVADADVPPLAASYPRRAVKVTVEQHAGMSQSAPSFDPTDMASLPMDDPRRQSWSARGPMLIHQAVSTSQHALGITRKDPNMRAKVSKGVVAWDLPPRLSLCRAAHTLNGAQTPYPLLHPV